MQRYGLVHGRRGVWLSVWALLGVALGCARIVAPSGGPRDSEPPEVVKISPPAGTVHFDKKRIRFHFDEYVKIKEPDKHLLISPPLEHRVYPLLKGKVVELPLRDTLKENTTYVVDFGESIVDLTEGNPLGTFRYAFSTGDHIDSCRVLGRLWDALLLRPMEGVKVMLYREERDSLPYTTPPDFWGKSDARGYFTVSNLPDEHFKLVALSETNGNYLYDNEKEMIGFVSERVQATCLLPTVDVDSVPQASELDSTQAPMPDSVMHALDSVHQVRKDSMLKAQHNALTVAMFSSFRKPQVFLKAMRLREDRVDVIFSTSPEGEVTLRLEDFPDASFWVEHHEGSDSVLFWMKDTAAVQPDTLQGFLSYLGVDSTGHLVPLEDTLRLVYRGAGAAKQEKKADTAIVTQRKRDTILSLKMHAVRAQALFPEDTLWIEGKEVLTHVHWDRVRILRAEDSVPLSYTTHESETTPWRVGVWFAREPHTPYIVEVDSGAVHNMWGVCNKKESWNVRSAKLNQYAILHLALSHMPTRSIVQVVTPDEKRQVIREGIFEGGEGTLRIDYIPPGTYGIRIIEDHDGNGRFTTGDYLKGRQPETVRYYREETTQKETVQVRQNWEYDIAIDYSTLHVE